MSAFLTRTVSTLLCLMLAAVPASAQNAPLALPSPAGPNGDKPALVSVPEPPGLALPPPAPPPVAPPAPKEPIATPVEAAPLGDVKTDSIGLLAANEGGLGAGLWKGTPRVLVEHVLPHLSLPLAYPSLNDLAARFLLTTAGSPEGNAGNGQTLTAMRVEKLVVLGKTAEAWKLIDLAGDQIDDNGLRSLTEAALVSPAANDACVKLPALIKNHSGIEWQKSMLVCQLAAKDVKAAQVSLDLLHAQDVHDDAFFAVAEKNIIAGNKQLPRQLTPLKPLTLALLRLADLPLRGEVYAHPDAALIHELLKAKVTDENTRLSLAERAATKGLIGASELADVYRSENFAPDAIADANISGLQGPQLRALLYQASQMEKNPKNRISQAVKFLASFDLEPIGGSAASLLGSMLGDIQPSPDFNAESATVTRIYILANKPGNALPWLELARNAARGMPPVAGDLQIMWPLAVLAGLESEKDFTRDLDAWLTAALRASGQQDTDVRAQKIAMSMLLLFDAVGFPVGDEAWSRVANGMTAEKVMMPPAMIMEKLRSAASGNRKGEAVLMGLLASGSGKEDPPLLAVVETVRALRAVGLAADAGNLAKDAAARILYTPVKP